MTTAEKAKICVYLATALARAGEHALARRMYDRLVSKASRDLNHNERIIFHVLRARLFLAMEEYDDARKALNDADELMGVADKEGPCYFAYLLAKGKLHKCEGESSRAETTLAAAADGIERIYGSHDIRFTEAVITLAELHLDQGHKEAASKAIRRIKAGEEERFGIAHPLVVKLQALKRDSAAR